MDNRIICKPEHSGEILRMKREFKSVKKQTVSDWPLAGRLKDDMNSLSRRTFARWFWISLIAYFFIWLMVIYIISGCAVELPAVEKLQGAVKIADNRYLKDDSVYICYSYYYNKLNVGDTIR